MNAPRCARIMWQQHPNLSPEAPEGVPGWLVLFPNGIAFAVQHDPAVNVPGLPVVYYPFDEAAFPGSIEWLD